MTPEKSDLLIIGCGIAGCAAAIVAAEQGLTVTIMTKSLDPREFTATRWAQGGIIYRGENDSAELLAQDIYRAGAEFGRMEAIMQLAKLGPQYVEEYLINKVGVPFDRNAEQQLDITEEAAHSVRRIIHVADLTGSAVEDYMVKYLKTLPNVRLVTGATAVDLLTLSHNSTNPEDLYKDLTCVGVHALILETGKVEAFMADETLLATGGLGQLYLHTTNPRSARGDGIAMAYRAGVRLLNLEYIQFHPTALYIPASSGPVRQYTPSFLISEAVRGEGGILVGADGQEFMDRYHPRKSLAPRDVVARAIHMEMLQNQEPCVYLDISCRPADWIKRRFPNIYEKCMSIGIDMTQQPIPVVPAAHYACGGIAVDLQGRTNMKRLRAAGEVACTGLHGANRLASTSLLEGLVWGVEVAKSVVEDKAANGGKPYYMPEIAPWRYEYEPADPALILQDWLTIKYTMWNYVGLVRSARRLKRARHILRELLTEIEYFYERAQLNDDVIGLRNGAQASIAVLYAALENRNSRGGHYRID